MGSMVCVIGGCRIENLWINFCRYIDCVLVEIICIFVWMLNFIIFKSIYFFFDMFFKKFLDNNI